MDVMGKSTINPLLFYTGKFAGYITWGILIPTMFGFDIIDHHTFLFNHYMAGVLLAIGLVFSAISLVNLGKSTRFGLPVEETILKTEGLYKISRNPMYVGFNLITIASILFTLNWIVFVLGVYSILVYHLIIIGEEEFMMNRFGRSYEIFKSNVRRYL